MKHFSFYIICFIILAACGKPYRATDPVTGNAPTTVSTDPDARCRIEKISQVNGTVTYFSISYQYGSTGFPIQITIAEPVTQLPTQQINFVASSDTFYYGAGVWLLKDAAHGQIAAMQVIDTGNGTLKDTIFYQYLYDAGKRLVQKRCFYNGNTKPDFITDYFYSGNALIGVKMVLGDGRKLLESAITYDPSVTIKPWVYLYTDAFESNRFLSGFPFGVSANYMVKQIQTSIYDTNTGDLLDKWQTIFSGYVVSKDGYVLQVNSTGDNQQGLAFLTGTLRINYVCK